MSLALSQVPLPRRLLEHIAREEVDAMRIFMSHASDNKLLLYDLKELLPQHLQIWIDEEQLLWGRNLGEALERAIVDGTDYVVLFFDEKAMNSDWVRREINLALDLEQRTGRTILLPVVMDRDAWHSFEPAEFRKRLYVSIDGVSRREVRNLAEELSEKLFALISADADTANRQNEDLRTRIAELERSTRQEPEPVTLSEPERYEMFLRQATANIRSRVIHHREDNPLTLESLWDRLRTTEEVRDLSAQGLSDLIYRLLRSGHLAGVYFDGDEIYYEGATIPLEDRENSEVEAKRKIAKAAARLIRSGMVVTLDAGSTTNAIVKRILPSIHSGTMVGLTVITNSIPAATSLIHALNSRSVVDSQPPVRVLLGGGRIRQSTLSVVPYPENAPSSIAELIESVGKVDLAIVGTTGVTEQGFTTGTREEATAKSALLAPGARHIVATTPSKFGRRQEYRFAELNGCEVLTAADGYEDVIKRYRAILEGAGATLTEA